MVVFRKQFSTKSVDKRGFDYALHYGNNSESCPFLIATKGGWLSRNFKSDSYCERKYFKRRKSQIHVRFRFFHCSTQFPCPRSFARKNNFIWINWTLAAIQTVAQADKNLGIMNSIGLFWHLSFKNVKNSYFRKWEKECVILVAVSCVPKLTLTEKSGHRNTQPVEIHDDATSLFWPQRFGRPWFTQPRIVAKL